MPLGLPIPNKNCVSIADMRIVLFNLHSNPSRSLERLKMIFGRLIATRIPDMVQGLLNKVERGIPTSVCFGAEATGGKRQGQGHHLRRGRVWPKGCGPRATTCDVAPAVSYV